MKTCVDKLALLGKPMNDEDLIEKILDELDNEYKSIVDAIEGRETLISFDKLHEKLINKELWYLNFTISIYLFLLNDS